MPSCLLAYRRRADARGNGLLATAVGADGWALLVAALQGGVGLATGLAGTQVLEGHGGSSPLALAAWAGVLEVTAVDRATLQEAR
jgi:hypothetical protein